MMNNQDYSKFLTRPEPTTLPESNRKSIKSISIAHTRTETPKLSNSNRKTNPYVTNYNFNPRVIPTSSSNKKIPPQPKIQNTNEANNSVLNTSTISHNTKHKINTCTSYTKSSVDNYLNRRHMQELEKLKRMQIEREKKEREIYSFAPKISNKSKKIVANIIRNESYTQNNYNNDNILLQEEKPYVNQVNYYNEDNYNQYNNYANEQYQNTYQQYDYGEQNKLIQTVSNYLNSNTNNPSNDNYKLDSETREFAMERLKALQQRINNNNYY